MSLHRQPILRSSQQTGRSGVWAVPLLMRLDARAAKKVLAIDGRATADFAAAAPRDLANLRGPKRLVVLLGCTLKLLRTMAFVSMSRMNVCWMMSMSCNK